MNSLIFSLFTNKKKYESSLIGAVMLQDAKKTGWHKGINHYLRLILVYL